MVHIVSFEISDEEHTALLDLQTFQGLSRAAVYRQALRLYQSGHVRRKAGETCSWSGDAERLREFAGGVTQSVKPGLPDLPGHLADAVRDSALAVLRRVVGFDQSREMAQQIIAHLVAMSQPRIVVDGLCVITTDPDDGVVLPYRSVQGPKVQEDTADD